MTRRDHGKAVYTEPTAKERSAPRQARSRQLAVVRLPRAQRRALRALRLHLRQVLLQIKGKWRLLVLHVLGQVTARQGGSLSSLLSALSLARATHVCFMDRSMARFRRWLRRSSSCGRRLAQASVATAAPTAAHRLRQPLHRLIDVEVVGGVQQVVVAQPVLLQLRANGRLRRPRRFRATRARACTPTRAHLVPPRNPRKSRLEELGQRL